ncbi:MAG: biopolymer transporter ExbD [Venatoribacter sp.]
MNFKRQLRESPEINLAPMIDVVFLLLIFFMVTTTFTKEAHLTINLPEASVEQVVSNPDSLDIVISSEGEYNINGRQLVDNQIGTLKRAIQKTLRDQKKAPVIITADARTPHEAVVRAMDAVGQLGLVNVSIATRHASTSE